jgi:hypothetical protein
MVKIGNLIVISIVAFALILVSLALGCQSYTPPSDSFFITGNDGIFHTNNIQQAQEKIPFEIIPPGYLPDGLKSLYPYMIEGPYTYPYEEGVEVRISYIKDDSRIYISEKNDIIVMEPTEELEPIYLNIRGVRVLRQKDYLSSSSHSIDGFSFDWNQDGMTFEVGIFNLSSDEGYKIVESMIAQVKS